MTARSWLRDLQFFGSTGKFTWRMCAVTLVAQSVCVFFGALVARGLALAGDNAAATAYLAVGSGLALLCVVAAGLMRTTLGLPLGWLIQAATFAAALVVPAMLLVGLIFTALWVTCIVQGRRVDRSQAAREQADPPSIS